MLNVLRKIWPSVRRITLALVIFYIVLVTGMYVFQRSFIYRPGMWQAAVTFEDYNCQRELPQTRDGLQIPGFYCPAEQAKSTILLLHGNAGNIQSLFAKAQLLRAQGYNVFAADYRGFSGNAGEPTEAGLQLDIEAAFGWLLAHGIAPQDIIVYGRSLGTGIATRLLAERAGDGQPPVAGLILESPYTSILDVAGIHYWYLPVRLLLRDRYDSLTNIAMVKEPTLIMHGDEDGLIPLAMGQTMFEASPAAIKKLVVYPGAGHENLFRLDNGAAVKAFLKEIGK